MCLIFLAGFCHAKRSHATKTACHAQAGIAHCAVAVGEFDWFIVPGIDEKTIWSTETCGRRQPTARRVLSLRATGPSRCPAVPSGSWRRLIPAGTPRRQHHATRANTTAAGTSPYRRCQWSVGPGAKAGTADPPDCVRCPLVPRTNHDTQLWGSI